MPICSAAFLLHHQPHRDEDILFSCQVRCDVTFTSSEIKKVESATLLEEVSWMDWSLYATWAIILKKCDDEVKCYCLFVAGAHKQ